MDFLRSWMVTFLMACMLLADSALIAQQWQFMNGPPGAWVNAIRDHPQYGTYIGTTNGVYMLGADSSWKNVFAGHAVYALAIDSSDGLYAASDDGLRRSTDGGRSWERIWSTWDLLSLIILPDSTIITRQGRSTNMGKSWEQDSFYTHQLIDHLLYNAHTGSVYAANLDLFRSRDNGATWQMVNISRDITAYDAIFGLAQSDSGMLFCSTYPRGIYSSTDDGESWSLLHTGIAALDSTVTQVWFEGGLLIVTGYSIRGVYWSSDNGTTWSHSGNGLPNIGITKFSRTQDGKWLAGTYGPGLFIASSLAGPWEACNRGLFEAGCLVLAIDSSGGMYTLYDGCVVHADKDVPEWELYGNNLPVSFGGSTPLVCAPTDSIMFLGSSTMSTDRGHSWHPVAGKPPSLEDMFFDKEGNLWGCSDKVYRSADYGLTWDTLADGYRRYWSIAVAPNGSIFVAGASGVIRSTNDGHTWNYSIGWGNNWGYCVAASPEGTIYCGKKDYGILRSTDNGTSWQYCNNGVAPEYFNVKHIVFNTLGTVFMNTSKGVYYSINRGDFWQLFGSPADTLEANTIKVDNHGYLYKLMDMGVYRSVESTLGLVTNSVMADGSAARFQLSQNYPNPFNPSTDIGYRTADLGLVTIKIYNLLGQVVATLVNEVKPPGEYRARWNALNNPSGIYFYKLTAGKYSEVRKMVITK